jgi:hypothetical protein
MYTLLAFAHLMLIFFQRAEDQTATMRALQKELSDVRALREREARQAEEDGEESKIFRDRCMKLEEELEMRQAEVSDAVNPFCQTM